MECGAGHVSKPLTSKQLSRQSILDVPDHVGMVSLLIDIVEVQREGCIVDNDSLLITL